MKEAIDELSDELSIEDAEKLIKYVHYIIEETEYNSYFEVVESLHNRDSKRGKALEVIYEDLEGKRYCSTCGKHKMRDELRQEYYCPIHD